VTISKAGIHATLSTQVSVIACMNPAYGVYNMRKSLAANIAMPLYTTSRFDLLYIMVETKTTEADRQVAKRVIANHRYQPTEEQVQIATKELEVQNTLTLRGLRVYIDFAKQFKPKLSSDASKLIVEAYVKFRDLHAVIETIVTPRVLSSLIRLSEAVAKLHFVWTVTVEHVRYAIGVYAVTFFQSYQQAKDFAESLQGSYMEPDLDSMMTGQMCTYEEFSRIMSEHFVDEDSVSFLQISAVFSQLCMNYDINFIGRYANEHHGSVESNTIFFY
jgi:DNA replication licensing factor MCM6